MVHIIWTILILFLSSSTLQYGPSDMSADSPSRQSDLKRRFSVYKECHALRFQSSDHSDKFQYTPMKSLNLSPMVLSGMVTFQNSQIQDYFGHLRHFEQSNIFKSRQVCGDIVLIRLYYIFNHLNCNSFSLVGMKPEKGYLPFQNLQSNYKKLKAKISKKMTDRPMMTNFYRSK